MPPAPSSAPSLIGRKHSTVIITFSTKSFALSEIRKHAVSSPEFDVIVPPVLKKRYIPPKTYPWKQASFLRIQEMTHRQFKIALIFLRFMREKSVILSHRSFLEIALPSVMINVSLL